jgi:outer membrane protein
MRVGALIASRILVWPSSDDNDCGGDMKRAINLAIMATTLLVSSLARADDGAWLIRLRAIDIEPEHKSDAIPALGVPADAIAASNKVAPELDVSYFLTQSIAFELILTYPQKLDVELNGTGIGSAKVLPPTLTVQYHFLPTGVVRPYVGAGINYTRFSSVNLNVPGVGALDLDGGSWGGALQAGVDFMVGRDKFINLDIKKIDIQSDVKLAATGTKVSHVTLSPIVIGVGFGWRF